MDEIEPRGSLLWGEIMVQTVGITKAITNLNEAHDKFNLSQTTEPQFFTEWFEDLPEITDSEKESLNRLINRYLYYAASGANTTRGIPALLAAAPEESRQAIARA